MATQPAFIERGIPPQGEGKCCPSCGFILAKPRVKSRVALTSEEKKQAQDVAKCEAAIAILERYCAMPEESPECKEAFGAEILRLRLALQFVHTDPYKLKRIFRRKET